MNSRIMFFVEVINAVISFHLFAKPEVLVQPYEAALGVSGIVIARTLCLLFALYSVHGAAEHLLDFKDRNAGKPDKKAK